MPSKLLAFFALPCFVLAGIATCAQSTSSAAEPRLEQASKDIEALLKEWAPETGPGCVYAAAKDGRTLFTRTYGMADLEHDVPITAESVFNVGSVSKQFTAAAALLLAQDGKLRLDDDIRKYLPEMPDYGRPITIRHLLNHTSGLREWTQLEPLSGRPLNWHAYRNADVLKIAARQRSLNHAPGDRYSYTNTGYVLLAIIVERVSGSSLPEFTRERLFKPLGMNSTGWDDNPRRIVKHRANGYRKAVSKSGAPAYVKAETESGVGNTYGSASLLTTAGDLLIWNNALDAGSLGAFVTTELQRKGVLNDGRTISYGAGLTILNENGQDIILHDGGLPGFKSILARFPRSRFSNVVLCNSDEAQPILISRKIAFALQPASFSRPEPAAKTDSGVTLTPQQLAVRTGVFIIEQTGYPVVITADNGHLVVDKELMETISETHFRSGAWGELVFKTPDVVERIIDEKTGRGEVQTLRRLDATIPDEAQLSEFTGRYTSDEADGSYSVVVEKGALMLKGSDLFGRQVGPSFPVSPVARDLFRTPGVILRFNRGQEGKVNSLDLTNNRIRALRFYRALAAPAP